MFGRFLGDSGGNFAMLFAVLAPVFMGIIGLAADYSIFSNQRSRMQETADAAALAAASEAVLSSWDETAAESVAADFIEQMLSRSDLSSAEYTHKVKANGKDGSVRVEIEQDGHGYILLGWLKNNPQIHVEATARAAGSQPVCAISTETTEAHSLQVRALSKLTASECSIYANSISAKAVSVDANTEIRTGMTCSAGGVEGPLFSFRPEPVTDCPALEDPLSARSATGSNNCMKSTGAILGLYLVMRPGTYCEDVVIDQLASVLLMPGVYVFRDASLIVKGNSSIAGNNVALQFEGEEARFEFLHDSKVSLTAPKKGALAGIAVYANRGNKAPRTFRIDSKDAARLVGTVYMPEDELVIGGDEDGDGVCDILPILNNTGISLKAGPIEVDLDVCDANLGANSEWTAIIARQIRLNHGVNVVLNADYDSSDIPLPGEFQSVNEKVYLSR